MIQRHKRHAFAPGDTVVHKTIQPGKAQWAFLLDAPIWQRTLVVNFTTSHIYLSPIMANLPEGQTSYLAEQDGEFVYEYKEHLYIEAGWLLSQTEDRFREQTRRLYYKLFTDMFPDYIEVPQYIEGLGLLAINREE